MIKAQSFATLLTFTVTLLTITVARAEVQAGTKPIDIGSRCELFVDDAIVERLVGKADFRLHHPTPREVVMVHDAPWEGNNTAASHDIIPRTSWWPEWRHDEYRSGCSHLAGAITKPVEHWRYFLGATSTAHVDDLSETPAQDVYDLDGKGGSYRVQVGGNVLSIVDAVTGIAVWRHELKACKEGYHAPIVADFDRSRPGLEVIVWPVEGNYFGDFHDLAYCFSLDKGVREGHVVWKVEPPVGKVHTAAFMVAEARAGGELDLLVMAWNGVTVWNGATGQVERRVVWPDVRHYGLGTCVRTAPKGPMWAVNIADYVPHIHVAELGDGLDKGKLVWERHYARTNELSTLMLRVRPNSVVDLDGDGVPEIVFNLYNEKKDFKWHLVVLDIRTGKTVLDVSDCFVWGIEDLDGDGRSELLCARVTHADPKALGELNVYRFAGNALTSFWSSKDARFLLKDVKSVPPHTFNGANEGRATALAADVDGDGIREFLIERDTDGDSSPDRFEAYTLNRAGAAELRWHFQAPGNGSVNARAVTAAVSGNFGRLQYCELSSGDLVTVDPQEKELMRTPGAISGYATVPVAADIDGDGRCEIALVNSRQEVELLAAPRANRKETVARRWKKRGQGMVLYQGYSLPTLTLGMADVDGDGVLEVLFSSQAKDGSATLVAARPNGSVLWEHLFAGVGTDGIYSGITRWFTGHFLGHTGKDVGVVFHRVGNGSNELAVLDGRSGEIAWGGVSKVRLSANAESYVGNRPLQSAHDFDGDGKDDIAFHEVYYTVILSGLTGKVLQGKGVVEVFGTTLNYAYLMLAPDESGGIPDLVLHGPNMHTMAQTFDMKKRWFRDWSLQANHFPPAFAAIDGVRVLGMPGEDGVFRCVGVTDGKLLWEEKIGHPGASSVGSADVDGDGLAEFFYVDKAGELVVVRGKVQPEQPRILWTHKVGAALDPIFADVDGDGKGEFLLVTNDGYLRCIGPVR